ncbi:MAG: hypothetical protein Q7T57_00875 [Dehalococcoidales bacterium]|nr:hypothetical protein [Dehalococcoidales bacterium]
MREVERRCLLLVRNNQSSSIEDAFTVAARERERERERRIHPHRSFLPCQIQSHRLKQVVLVSPPPASSMRLISVFPSAVSRFDAAGRPAGRVLLADEMCLGRSIRAIGER